MGYLIEKEKVMSIINEMVEYIHELPDESPEKKIGAWQRITINNISWYQCPNCQHRPLLNCITKKPQLSRFCPHCGATLTGVRAQDLKDSKLPNASVKITPDGIEMLIETSDSSLIDEITKVLMTWEEQKIE